MSLFDRVKANDLYQEVLENLTPADKELVETEIERLSEKLQQINDGMKSLLMSKDDRTSVLDELDDLLSATTVVSFQYVHTHPH